MNKAVLVLAVSLAAASWCAAAPASAAPANVALENGGRIVKPGTFLGKVAIVDAQSAVAFSNVQAVAAQLAAATELNIVAVRGEAAAPAALKASLKADVLLEVIDDADAPAMLLAPDDHWGSVNLAKIVADLPSERAKLRFRESRARKQVIRAFSLMCGGGASQFPGNIMNAATVRELDTTIDGIPVDMIDRWQTYLKNFGVTRKVEATYRDACEQGWAPAPKTDVEKAIWAEYNEPATAGIEIKFDPKKGE